MKDLKEVIQEHYKLLNCDKDDKEVIVYMADRGKHNNNKKKNSLRNKKFTGMCNNCGEHYYKENDYWALEQNAHKYPQ